MEKCFLKVVIGQSHCSLSICRDCGCASRWKI